MFFAVAIAHLRDGVDAHVFERAIEKHAAIVARGMMSDFGGHIFVTEHIECSYGFGATSKSPWVS